MKQHDENEKIIPEQHDGTKKDIDTTVTVSDLNDARKLYNIGRNRLVDVNQWGELCGIASASFRLTDQQGREVSRTAEVGDYFKIDLPAPGSQEGHGHDWVRIEAIEDNSNPNGDKESIAIKVRPSPDPEYKGEDVAHFFNDEATSSFVLMRDGTKVTAAVFGRNEIPNTETDNIVDKVRNAVVGVSAMIGMSNIQWKSLTNGLLDTETDS